MKTARRKTKIIALVTVLVICLTGLALIMTACNNDDDYRNPRNGEPEAGKYYTLQNAYDNGWLSKNELKSISYYHAKYVYNKNIKVFGKYKPIPLNPEILPDNIENTIKQTYLLDLNKLIPDAEISGVHITRYYGIYDDCVVVTVRDDYVNVDLLIEEEYIIGGVKFYNYDYQIRVYAK